jgi:hypothetical protein
MRFEVIALKKFKTQISKLSKKYPSLKELYFALVDELEENPLIGKSIGHKCYKFMIKAKSRPSATKS